MPQLTTNLIHLSLDGNVGPLDSGVLGEWPAAPAPADGPFPENFYTYRTDLIPQSHLNNLREQVEVLQMLPEREAARFKAKNALAAIAAWQAGNRYSERSQYGLAIESYTQCEIGIVEYFASLMGLENTRVGTPRARLKVVMNKYAEFNDPTFWEPIRFRHQLKSLGQLWEEDRIKPFGTDGAFDNATSLLSTFLGVLSVGGEIDPTAPARLQRLDRLLLILGLVYVPLARAELNLQRRQFDAATGELVSLLLDNLSRDPQPQFRYLCASIEEPFIKLLRTEITLDKAEALFKAGNKEPIVDPISEELENLPLPAMYYWEVTESFQAYTVHVNKGRDTLKADVQKRLDEKDTRTLKFKLLGKTASVSTIRPIDSKLPGLNRESAPHEPEVIITGSEAEPRNPRVYALLLTARARLEQIKAGFNYLGYKDDYVPPLRFHYLLERARYYAEHAKNAQRDYLNFLSNAERDEFQETSAAQAVELEKTNVRIETARVDQVQLEVAAAQQSADAAALAAQNLRNKLRATLDYQYQIQQIEDDSFLSSFGLSLGKFIVGAVSGNAGMAASGFSGAMSSIGEANRQDGIRGAQFYLEQYTQELGIKEADAAKGIADTRLLSAKAGLLVAGLQRQAAVLRQEFARQNLSYIRNRSLNSDQWFRLAAMIRRVSETYLRYAIEQAFLTEQAYEFEADKQLNVIRFDYDQSEVGAYLAGDFLLRDLDTIENDLIVSQRQRQQQVRYVISLAREFPVTLQQLREQQRATLSIPLELLERRLPGLYNLRVGMVDITPVALLDPTRFRLDLTHLGSGQLRLKSRPEREIAPNETPSEWEIKTFLSQPETVVFTGLSRQDSATAFPTSAQRNAFEGRPVAGAWEIDFSSRENRTVPGSLDDLLITFTASAYYDEGLQFATSPRAVEVTTSWLSGAQAFPDAFYEFNRSGRMEWHVTEDCLTLTESVGKLRNIGMMLVPAPSRVQYGRLACHHRIDFQLTNDGAVILRNIVPRVTYDLPDSDSDPTLELRVKAEFVDGAEVTWDFGDGSERKKQVGGAQWIPHTYARKGRYEVTLRLVRDGHLSEYKSDVIVSGDSKELEPLMSAPTLKPDPDANVEEGKKRVVANVGVVSRGPDGIEEDVKVFWVLKNAQTTKIGKEVFFDLKPGTYTLSLFLARNLNARVFSNQPNAPNAAMTTEGLSLNTNRRFDDDGNLIADEDPARPLSTYLFPTNEVLSPADKWGLELKLEDNPCLRGIGRSGAVELDLGGVQDAILSLEYEVNSD